MNPDSRPAGQPARTTAGKLWQTMTGGQRRAAGILLVLIFIGMILETLGVGLIIPVIALVTEPNPAAKYPLLAPWLARLGNPSHARLAAGAMCALVGVYLIKAVYLGFLAWRQSRFVYRLQAELSQRMFSGYMRQPYAFHLQRNSAQLMRNTLNEAGVLASGGVQSALAAITELLILAGISVMLVVVEPLGALLVITTLGVAGWTFVRFTRHRVLYWGQAIQRHEGHRIQCLQEGLGAAKDVKLLGREDLFLDKYGVHNVGTAQLRERQLTIAALPRLWLEVLTVIGLAVLVIVMIARGRPVATLLPTLALFAAAAFRFMPSVNRVVMALQTMRASFPSIDTVYEELRLLEDVPRPTSAGRLPFVRALELDRVSFQYPATDAYALRDVSLSIPAGASVGFVGISGAGKSTIVDIILGLLTPTAGVVAVDGTDIQTNLRGWQDELGYVPQSLFLTDDTLRRNVAFGIADDKIEDAAVWRALRAAQLDEFVQALPDGLETSVGERGVRVSGGQRQRIGIARALYHDPSVLVLDEATSALDTETERGFMDAVQALQGDKTIIIVAHRLSTVEHCDRLFRLQNGRLVTQDAAAGSPTLATGAVVS